MTIIELLSQLRDLDIYLWLDGERLRFDAPAGALTPDLRAQLAEHKAQIIALLRDADRAERPAPIMPAPRDEPPPLSFAQQRLWFLDQLEPGSVAYTIPAAVRLAGRLDLALLAGCLDAIMRRHEVLRTTFALRDGQPVQIIAAAATCPLALLDLSAAPPADREPALRELLRAALGRPFDLARGPILRTYLLRLAADEHVLLLTIHHIAADGWSTGVFIRELVALYQAGFSDQAAQLPKLPIQYADYAIWQRAWLQGSGVRGQGPGRQGDKETRRQGDREQGGSDPPSQPAPCATLVPHPSPPPALRLSPIEAQLAYWRAQLAGLPPLDLPTDRRRPPVQSFRGATYLFTLPPALAQAAQSLSRQAGATLFMTLLAVFQALLARYSGQSDLAVGTPIAGRAQAETEPLIGFFVNTLVLRAEVRGNPSFRELLRRVREVCLAAYAHQELPFERLVEALQPERDLSRSPLFQVLFALENPPPPVTDLPGLRLRPVEIESETAKFDLSLFVAEQEQGLIGSLEYAADLFEAATIAGLARHLQTLLEEIAADPDRRVFDLPLLTAAERHQLLVAWNATAAEYPQDICVQQLFENQALRAPDAVALVFDRPTTNDQRPTTEDRGWKIEDRRSKIASFSSSILDPRSSVLNPEQLTDHRPPLHPFTPSPLHPFTCQHLTYRELNRRANQLAHHLQALGAGLEVRIGICVQRSPEMVIGVLGVLKVGAAYLPLDPTYPAERLAFMLDDAQVAVLLTTTDDRPPTTDQRPTTNDQRPTNDHQRPPTTDQRTDTVYPAPNDDRLAIRCSPSPLHPFTPSPLHLPNPQSPTPNPQPPIPIDLCADWPVIAQSPAESPTSGATAENLAYVIYTSGSTGRPKGVQISHGALVNFLYAMRGQPGLAARDRLLAVTSLSFDIAGLELFLPLIEGARLTLASRETAADGKTLRVLLDRVDATVMQATPATWRLLLEAGWTGSQRLTVLCGGEALPRGLAEQLLERSAALWNLYGPTETTIWSTITRVSAGTGAIAIGRPIANTQVYVLDPHMQPAPVGVAGELCIGGAGLARGYLGHPDLTAERFIPNPFAGVMGDGCWVLEDSAPVTQHPTPNTRLYQTGDLARYRTDGTIEFLGRIDQQVKLRGYRIEPGEVEALLRQHPSVRESAVVVREDAPDDVRLVAYLVPEIEDRGLKIEDSGSSAPDPLSSILYPLSSELRAFLKQRLPEYMVPSAFVALDALPLTPNGKLDRRALPAPERRSEADGAFAAPRTPVEEVLAGIWAGVLNLEQVGVHDNFFALGGHSLLATQVLSRIRALCQVDLPLRRLFEAPTVAEFAALIEIARREATAPPAPPLLPVQRDGPPPLSFAQQRLWFLDQLEPGSVAYTIPAAVRLAGRLDLGVLAVSLSAIVRRHEALRTTFALRDGQPVQIIAATATCPLALVDLSGLPAAGHAAMLNALVRAVLGRPFDLARGPVLRVVLFQLAPDSHTLLLAIHHIAADGWSSGIFIRELAALYQAGVVGQVAALPKLPVQYADYAIWQRAWLQGEQGSGVRGQGSGDKETRRQGDKETGSREHALPNPQSPIPNPQSPISGPPSQPAPCATLVPHPSPPPALRLSPIDAQLAYWRQQLADLPPLDLPTDRPRPPVQSFRGATTTFQLPAALSQAAQAFSRRAGATLFMTLLAAWQVLLARYSGQFDLAVGTPIANRTQAATEELIGFFVNTLVLRADMSGRSSFREVLGYTREVCLDAYAHQDLPFERLVETLQPARDLSRTPLFQVLFALQNTAMPALELVGLTLHPFAIDGETAKFDLSLYMDEGEQGLVGGVEYATDLFDAATIARLVRHFQTLLEGIVADPDLAIMSLPLLSAAEREQLLIEWNATALDYPRAACIHTLFAAQADRTPDAVAVVFDRGQGSGVRGQEDKETRRQGDKETRSLGSGVWGQGTTASLPPPAGGGIEGGAETSRQADKQTRSSTETQPPTPNTQHPTPNTRHLTYHELNRRATQLAHRLQRLGVGPEERIAICMDRTPELLIGLLGVLMAGGAYVPLDPNYPPERRAFMLADAQARVLLTTDDRRPTTDDRPTTTDQRRPTNDDRPTTNDQRSTTNDYPLTPSPCHPITLSPHHLVTLSESWPAITLCAADDPVGALDPANLAYVIYTSGSTGRPKGVAISHASAVAFLAWTRAQFAPAQLAGVLAATSICFDLSVFELFAPLSVGGAVILAENVLQLPSLSAAASVTLINTVPSALAELLRLAALPASARTINLAGEPLPQRLVQQLYQDSHVRQVFNLYGPTEATTYATGALVPPERRTPPIGRPIANTQLYLLDAQLQPVPVGVVGEIYLGGAGLARGYLGRPDLTAEWFVPNPFLKIEDRRLKIEDSGLAAHESLSSIFYPLSSESDRLYKTGDRARYLEDGQLEYLGRLDQQVKIRGFRIEPGEIEAALGRHPAVRECVVVVREDVPGDQRLVGYVVPDARRLDEAAPEPAWDAEQVAQWQSVWETTYAQPQQHDPTFDTGGWRSSYTGEPIPAAEMREFVDRTVERVLSLRPRRVLEVGCGAGLLLFPIAPACAQYWGTDIARTALLNLQRHLAAAGPSLAHVALFQRAADDFADMAADSFDTLILNSVVQYFPNVAYLVRVLEGALRAVAPGGHIFVGDVRSLPLLEAFHTAVLLERAPADLPLATLRQQVRARVAQEQELVVDPAFFVALRRRFPKIGAVDIRLKRGRYHNELTQFRYDVIIHVGPASPPAAPLSWFDWRQHELTVPDVRQLLEQHAPDALAIARVPNARVLPAVAALEWLARPDGLEAVSDLRRALRDEPGRAGVDPEELWGLAREVPYTVALRWSGDGADGCYDVLFTRRAATEGEEQVAPRFSEAAVQLKPWSDYANNPAREKAARDLAPQLRSFLKAALPEHMLPSALVLLPALPLTPNGKLDRRALPAPETTRPQQTFVAPADPLELQLARIWEDLLDVYPIGTTDDFFDLGGHSLLTVRLIAQIRQRLGQDLPLSVLFQGATIARLAQLLRRDSPIPPHSPLVAIQPGGTRRPFFCIHALWGSAMPYVDLARQLGPDQPVYGLQSPGIEVDQEPFGELAAMAAHYLDALRAAQPRGPYLLGGWSMGGILAFEIARQLRQRGEAVDLLAIIDSAAPVDGAYQRADLDDTALLAEFVHDLPMQFQHEVPEAYRELLELGAEAQGRAAEEQLSAILERARAVGAIPPDVDLARLRRLFGVFKDNVRTLAGYTPSACAQSISLFRAGQDLADDGSDPTMGWRALALGGVEVERVPGDHATLIRPPNVQVLAARLRARLDAIQPRTED